MPTIGRCVLASLALLLLVVVVALDARKIVILDEAGASSDVEPIAQEVCEITTGTSKQIAHISNIARLADHLRAAANSPDHKLFVCSQKYLQSLDDLVRVLNEANTDVCGEEKLRLIEDFHLKYVSKVKKHVRQQKRSNKVPKVVKLFFMHWASEISGLCEQRALEALAKVDDGKQALSDEEMNQMSQARAFTDALGMSDLSRGYEGIYLMWNMVDALPLDEDERFTRYLTEGGDVRLNVQLSDPSKFVTTQVICSQKMRPIYSQTLLPVLRLTDLGYYPHSDRLSSQLKDETSPIARLFIVTQLCETILPLRVFYDSQLKPDEVVAITKEEAASLKPIEIPAKLMEELEKTPMKQLEAAPVSMMNVDRLKAVHVGEARERIERIKADVEARSKIMVKMLRMLMRNMKKKMSSTVGKYLLKSKNKVIEALDGSVAQQHLEEAERKLQRRRRDAATRWKRTEPEPINAWTIFKAIANGIGLLIAQIILWAFKLAILLPVTILTWLMDLFTFGLINFEPIYDALADTWYFTFIDVLKPSNV